MRGVKEKRSGMAAGIALRVGTIAVALLVEAALLWRDAMETETLFRTLFWILLAGVLEGSSVPTFLN